MKKVLITFVLLLMAVGVFGQNTFRYIINANGGIAVTAPFSFGGITITSTGAQINFLNTATSNIQTQLNGKVNISDTTSMLIPYINRADTAAMLTPYLKSTDIQGKVNISDTATMLTPYINRADTASMLTDYINKTDTASMLIPYINKADTASALLNYILESEVASTYLPISNPTATGTGTFPILKVGDATSNTITSIDSISHVTGATDINFFDGPDTLNPYIPYSGRVDLYEAMDTSALIATKYDLDTLTVTGGIDAGDVAAQINDTIVARLAVAVPGVRLVDSVNYPSGYMSRYDGVTGLATKVSYSDTIASIATKYDLIDTIDVSQVFVSKADSGVYEGGYTTPSDLDDFAGGLITDNTFLLGLQALGSPIKAVPLGIYNNTWGLDHTAMEDGKQILLAVYLPKAETITGVGFILNLAGDYTADNYNGIGLFSYSGGNVTLVASSTNNGNIWKATADTWTIEPFSTPYNAAMGVYYVAAMYNNSAQTTAPQLYRTNLLHANIMMSYSLTNSAKLSTNEGTFTAFTNRTMATGNAIAYCFGLFLY